MNSTDLQVAIAGASGFVGRSLTATLAKQARVVALSRRPTTGPLEPEVGTPCWRQVNLFNLKHTERALQGAQVAVYLVHSMLPTARLSQGHFKDLDLICADNFARAARNAGVKRLVYLSGLIPKERPLSPHLASRYEIEQALADHGIPVVSLRAGIVVGPQGSSFTMMMRLVERLPVMLLPQWTGSRCQPVALADVVQVLSHYVLEASQPAAMSPTKTECWDIGGPTILSYSDMLRRCAELTKRRRWFVPVPFWTPGISLWWVHCITGAPLELVGPLVQSLRHDMVVRHPLPNALADLQHTTFDAAVEGALAFREGQGRRQTKGLLPPTRPSQRARGVISVQRLPLPEGKNAAWVACEYSRFLPSALGWVGRLMLRIEEKGRAGESGYEVTFRLAGLRWILLRLCFAHDRSDADRQLFYLKGGLLARQTDAQEPGRFEFRTVLGRKWVLCAVHDFVPRLPWFVYRGTQALIHALVMKRYGVYLGRISPTT